MKMIKRVGAIVLIATLIIPTSLTTYASEVDANDALVNMDEANDLDIPDQVSLDDIPDEITPDDAPEQIALDDPVGEVAEEVIEENELEDATKSDASGFETNGNVLVKYTGTATNVVIPSNITEISDEAFLNNSTMQTVTLPANLTKIGAKAFKGCSKLTALTIPSKVTTLGLNCFANCAQLATVTVKSNNIPSVTGPVFNSCPKLTKVEFSEGMTCIPTFFCQDATALKTIIFSSTIQRIGKYAFSGCTSIENITLPEQLVFIEEFAFKGCSSMKNLTIPANVRTINKGAFMDCSSITGVIVNALNLTSTQEDIFKNCASLNAVAFIDGITMIPANMFINSAAITIVYLPNTLTSIGNKSFSGCTALTTIAFPATLTSIGQSAFSDCSSLTAVVIPEGVTSIGANAFYGCSSLNSFIINARNLQSVGKDVFAECTSLMTVVLPEGMAILPDNMFFDAKSLTSINIPSTVTTIGTHAFYNCHNLASVSIPSSVTTIGTYAFYNCTSMSSLTIPYGVTTIGDKAFKGCVLITSVTIPDSVTTFGQFVFENCSALGEIEIGKGLTTLPANALARCTNLYSVKIPSNITKIGDFAFQGCSVLSEVYFLNPKIQIGSNIFYDEAIRPAVYGYEGSTAQKYANDLNAKNPGKCYFISLGKYAEYTIVFVKNNTKATGSMNNQPMVYGAYETGAALSYNAFKLKGYTFDSWNTKANGTGVKFSDGQVVSNLTSNDGGKIKLYAQWKKAQYSITYNLDGGVNNSKNPTSYSMTNKNITLKNPKKSGYTFVGWYTKPNYKNKVTSIAAGSSGNKTLYAKWSPNKYTIVFNAHGGTGSMKNKTASYNKAVTLKSNSFKRAGYSFIGWNTKKNGTGKMFSNKDTVLNLSSKNGATVNLYAQWQIETYTITYNLNDGINDASNPTSYTVKTSNIKLAKPQKAGYKFVGWYSDSKYKNKVTSIPKGSVGNKTLYAKWKEIK